MPDYIISTTDIEEAALTAHIARENANAASMSQQPWPDNQAYITATAKRFLLDPLTSLYVEAAVVKLGAQARHATLAELEAADAALPDTP